VGQTTTPSLTAVNKLKKEKKKEGRREKRTAILMVPSGKGEERRREMGKELKYKRRE